MTKAEVQDAHRRRLASADAGTGLGFWVGFHAAEFIGWWLLQPPHGPDQPQVAGEADLGYRLVSRHWRKGYATEGARELIRYGFEELGLTRIFAQTLAVCQRRLNVDPSSSFENGPSPVLSRRSWLV
jgi:RimJ/RimL family protein N-acetyltransferase